MAETMRYCPNCGFKIPAGTKFCPNCGADLTIFNARVAGETDFGREQSQQPAASEPVREQVRGERSRRQRQSGSTSIKKSLVLTDDSFDHFIDWLATHMVYTLIGVMVLFCVFSFSTIAGWVL
ncbi:Membrane protein, partial [Lacticaseibacillus paracasei subsp. paracasei Lpp123]